ncbi:mesogenin-1 [Spea bombifrons]|uniref:mesogenin-1 n=1 Tax=Spea bombifrons TaxID=233779 RepID=UPI00234BAD3E|nr:mesogenin-1 [Spea bombifrons]
METLHQHIIKMEEDYTLGSDSDPDAAYMASSWNWKNNSDSYSFSQTPSPQSLSPAASFESPSSGSSQPPGFEEMSLNEEMVAYRLFPYSAQCQYEAAKGTGEQPRREHGYKASMTTQRRRKASEREKMRMRAIADALHTLRSNLPPTYSQGRQPLTKIQTLKCTISYIEELTNILNNTKGTY